MPRFGGPQVLARPVAVRPVRSRLLAVRAPRRVQRVRRRPRPRRAVRRGVRHAVRDGGAEPDLPVYGTFRLNFHHFDRFELDLRGHTQVWGAAFSCLRLKWADMVLI